MRTVDLGSFDYTTDVVPVAQGSRAQHIVARTACHACSWRSAWNTYTRETVAEAIRHQAHAHNPYRRTA